MRLHILSDLHLEFEGFDPPPVDADVVILAGDIGVGLQGVEWAAETFPETPVVYVPGNHEYYSHAIPGLTEALFSTGRKTGVHVLSNTGVTLGGVRFLGATLWTDFRLQGNLDGGIREARLRMNDFLRIGRSDGSGLFTPEESIQLHADCRLWLGTELASVDVPTVGGPTVDVPTVVVTHHAPSLRCIAPEFRREPLGPAFASHLDDFVFRSDASVWIHGHTHFKTDFTLGRTRVVSNQKGYPFESVSGFDPGFVIEI